MKIAVLAGAGVVPPIEIVGKIKGAEVYGISALTSSINSFA